MSKDSFFSFYSENGYSVLEENQLTNLKQSFMTFLREKSEQVGGAEGERNLSRIQRKHRAQNGTQTHDPEIMT